MSPEFRAGERTSDKPEPRCCGKVMDYVSASVQDADGNDTGEIEDFYVCGTCDAEAH